MMTLTPKSEKIKAAKKTIRECILVDQITFKKDGTIIFYKGFFYSMGGSAEKFEEKITNELNAFGIRHNVLKSGEQWKAFRGSDTTAQGSHWYVHIELI